MTIINVIKTCSSSDNKNGANDWDELQLQIVVINLVPLWVVILAVGLNVNMIMPACWSVHSFLLQGSSDICNFLIRPTIWLQL